MDNPNQPYQRGATGGTGRGGKRRRNGNGKNNSPPKSDTSTADESTTSSLSDVTPSLQELEIAPISAEAGQSEATPLDTPATPATTPADPPAATTPADPPAATPADTISIVHTEKNLFPPARPDHGKCGNKINLLVNFFHLEVTGGEVIQYDVRVFTEEMVKRKGYEGNGMTDRDEKAYVMKVFLEQCGKLYPKEYPVYDGRAIMYSRRALMGSSPFIKHEIEWRDPEDGYNGVKRRAHVVLRPASKVDLSILSHFLNRKENYRTCAERENELDRLQEAMHAIEVILKELPKAQAVPLGRNFYFKPGKVTESNELGGGRWMWDGFSQTVRPGQWKPFINIDKTCGVFVKPVPLLEFILSMLNTDDLNWAFDPSSRKNSQRISDHLYNIRVISSHMKHPKRNRIVSRGKVLLKSARDEKFDKDGKMISVEQYFLQQYKITLKYPLIPCINVGKPATAGKPSRHVALPIELCLVKDGQRSGPELESDQTTKVLKFAARPANERRDMIQDIARNVLGKSDEVQKHYGIRTNSEMLQVEGRVLQPPLILYDKDKRAQPSRGQWDITQYKLLQAKGMENWVLIDFCRTYDDKITAFVRELISQGASKGMDIKLPHEIVHRQPRTDVEIRKLMLDLKQHFGSLQLFIIILDERMPPRKFSAVVYREVKKVGDTEIGVPTQCVKQMNVNKANGSTVGNICLKINAKLGGVNHGIIMDGTPTAKLLNVPTMFMGADVNHPKPGTDRYTPSIAAAVATLDRRLAKYASSCRFQQHERADVDVSSGAKRRYRKEIIIEFQAMAKELIEAFISYNKDRKPAKIIYYRDGVSDGQFSHVLQHELLGLRAACTEIDPEYKPSMTIVVVQKRHHLRMFPANPRDACGKAQNIPPGTTLDHSVTHPIEFNFYLNSHFALQGTAKCALYHVLWDENNFNADTLQAITYQLCHTYARCAKSVSYPTPVYYSHWVAYRYSKSAGYGDPDRDRNQLIPPDGDWDKFRREVKTDLGTMYWA